MKIWQWFTVWLGLLFLDQVTKIALVRFYPSVVVYNDGIAFSINVSSIVTIGLALTVVIALNIAFFRGLLDRPWLWALLLAGTTGNLIDRIRLGAVIDFINLGFFPVFNFADIFLTVSAVLIIYFYFYGKH